MQSEVKRSVWSQGIKSGLIAFVFSCIGVLVLALLAKTFGIAEKVLPIVNQVIKVVAAAIAAAIIVKDEKFVVKGLIGAIVFWILSFTMFLILGGKFNVGQLFLDLVIALVAFLLVAVIKSRRSYQKFASEKIQTIK